MLTIMLKKVHVLRTMVDPLTQIIPFLHWILTVNIAPRVDVNHKTPIKIATNKKLRCNIKPFGNARFCLPVLIKICCYSSETKTYKKRRWEIKTFLFVVLTTISIGQTFWNSTCINVNLMRLESVLMISKHVSILILIAVIDTK